MKTRVTVTLDIETEELLVELAHLFGMSVSGYMQHTLEHWRPVYSILLDRARKNRSLALELEQKLLDESLQSLK